MRKPKLTKRQYRQQKRKLHDIFWRQIRTVIVERLQGLSATNYNDRVFSTGYAVFLRAKRYKAALRYLDGLPPLQWWQEPSVEVNTHDYKRVGKHILEQMEARK